MLAMAVGQLTAMLNVPPPSRASLAPTLNLGVLTDLAFSTNPLWELSLLAMAVGQLAAMLNVPPPSRASLAPTLNLEVFTDLAFSTNPLWELSLLPH
ncbi:hypothetical protein [Pseudomonas brassicacearum]|uniref:hypothetical protein n=1 Tax=Pseudomonas brassicacearum TaxID=930166 RepID=UPI0012980AB4|nr:hypothetical protein [Pseudomonas brassicacearum]QGA51637.1 hypothetical protein GFU70_21840 [Pseudomonas brassicacearum]